MTNSAALTQRRRVFFKTLCLCVSAAMGWSISQHPADAQAVATTLAVIGDYGTPGQPGDDVATLVASWNPDAVLTTGDNNYPAGASATIDSNIGRRYHGFIAPYTGTYGGGATQNQFWPSLGNHDWDTPGAQPYLDYFSLPGNERHYTTTVGLVEVFVLDSDPREPDGISASSVQAAWLQRALAASPAVWRIVVFHHPPYSSSSVHGSTPALQWPFAAYGADLVLSGHDHTYERLAVGGLTYIVNGAGGAGLYGLGPPVPGSLARFNADHGALRLQATTQALSGAFVTRSGLTVDSFTLWPGPLSHRVWLQALGKDDQNWVNCGLARQAWSD